MKSAKRELAKTAANAALGSLLLIATVGLTACSESNKGDDYVQCYGVSNAGNNVPVVMPKGICEKLAGAKPVAFSTNDYVECYGVAAAGKNDCATNSSACGGSVATDKSPAAWLAMPRGICVQLAGAKVGAITQPGKNNAKTGS